MNIIEAIKSGKRFKRQGWERWREEHEIYQFLRSDILADDWDVELTAVTITRQQFIETWESVTKYIAETQPFFRPDLAQEMLCRKLGL